MRVKHGIITQMEYDNNMPDDVRHNGNLCTYEERERLGRATDHTLETVNISMKNYDEKKFRKWFGKDNDLQPDWLVKQRIINAYNFMNRGF